MSLLLEKETVDYILSQDYDWKPNPVIPEILRSDPRSHLTAKG